MTIVYPISISLSPAVIRNRLHLPDETVAAGLLAEAQSFMAAKAVYKVCYVQEKSENAVVIDGERFVSRVLGKNLADVGRVFAFVLTLGMIFDEKIEQVADLLQKYYLDEIGNLALRQARAKLDEHLRGTYAIDKISCMAPGSLQDWPIEEQAGVFRLIGGVETAIGVRLTDSMLMLPRKSISGLYFPSKGSFFSCRLCPRDRCDGRKALYDEALAREYGVVEEK